MTEHFDPLPESTPSPIHIWRAVTGGGKPVDYLRWLASQWEIYVHTPEYRRMYGYFSEHYFGNKLSQVLRDTFRAWISERFYEQTGAI